jgi:hypothetical protein
MPTEPNVWIDTEHDGRILYWSPDALSFIGCSATAAKGQCLPVLFIGNRPQEAHLTRVMFGHSLEREGMIRPHDRSIPVRYWIDLADHSTQGRPILRWTFQRR